MPRQQLGPLSEDGTSVSPHRNGAPVAPEATGDVVRSIEDVA
jgi:hypothetical protein